MLFVALDQSEAAPEKIDAAGSVEKPSAGHRAAYRFCGNVSGGWADCGLPRAQRMLEVLRGLR